MINLQPGIPQKEPKHFETILFIVSQFWKIGIFGHALWNFKDKKLPFESWPPPKTSRFRHFCLSPKRPYQNPRVYDITDIFRIELESQQKEFILMARTTAEVMPGHV